MTSEWISMKSEVFKNRSVALKGRGSIYPGENETLGHFRPSEMTY